jgi:hypothetical protein
MSTRTQAAVRRRHDDQSMTNRSDPSLPRLLASAAVCGAAAGLLALLVVQAGVWLVPTPRGVVDANIGLGLAALAAQPLVAGLLAWGGLRALGAPSAGASALAALPLYVVCAWPVMAADSAAVPFLPEGPAFGLLSSAVVAGALPMLAATTAGASVVRAVRFSLSR